MTKRNEAPKTEAVETEDEAGVSRFVNTTLGVFNYAGQSVPPGGTLKVTDMNMSDKGLMHLISTGGLKSAS